MSAQIPIDGVMHTAEKRGDGVIRISHAGAQINPMFGPGTDFDHSYLVYPCQRHQYEFWNSQLPPAEQAAPASQPADRPWWSFGAGERAGLRE